MIDRSTIRSIDEESRTRDSEYFVIQQCFTDCWVEYAALLLQPNVNEDEMKNETKTSRSKRRRRRKSSSSHRGRRKLPRLRTNTHSKMASFWDHFFVLCVY